MPTLPSHKAPEAPQPFTGDEPRLVRPLGGHERLMHHYSASHPRHFCTVAELAADRQPEDYSAAFAMVQRRHPMLSVFLANDPRSGPCAYRSDHPLKIAFVPLSEEPDWRYVVERELVTPFPAGEAPLMRVTILHGPGRATIVLTFHHAISDGMSAAYVVQDLMEALDGRPLPPLPVPAPIEIAAGATLSRDAETETSGLRADPEILRSIADSPLWRPFEGDEVTVSSVAFDRDFTALLLQRSRENGTTMHGALCAALAGSAAAAGHGKETYAITSAISFRPLLGLDRRECCLFASAGTVRFPLESAHDFWRLARRATDELAPARTPAGMANIIDVVEANLPPRAEGKIASGLFGTLQYDAILSNLGALPLQTEVGAIRLEAFWGPAVLGRFTNERMIGAASIGGKLRLTHSAPRHMPPLLNKMEEMLRQACTAA